MNWPNHTDYQDSIQNPAICFAEDELKKSTVISDMLGMPRVMSGNFASVYELSDTQGKHHAIRCFVRQVTNQQVRYNMVTRHLQASSLKHLVGFEFILRGIRVKGEWYPIVRMDWVKGVPMHMYVDDHVNEPETMLRLATQWRGLVKEMRDNQISHCDLQHGNVMCSPDGEFKLVDYDCMYVPSFGQSRSPELGHANYQHPRRTPENYDLNLDNFGALVIYTSFLALAKDPSLWKKFHTGDNLVLLSNDFKDPRNSKAFQALKQNPDAEVQKLTSVLERACIWPIAQVPGFEETLTALASGTLPEPAPMPAPVAATPDWLTSTSTDVSGSRPAAKSGTRASPAPASPKVEARPAATPAPRPIARPTGGRDYSNSTAEVKTQPLHTTTVMAGNQAPIKTPEEPPAFNIFAWISAALAIVACVPKLQVIGLPAAVCGIIGWTRADPRDNSKWAALAGMVLGMLLAMWGILTILQKRKTAGAREATSIVRLCVPKDTPAWKATLATWPV